MAVLRSVAKTDTFEKQRKIINLLAQDIYDYVGGGSGISILAGEFGDGSIEFPSIRFASDINLGFFKEDTSKMGVAAASNHLVSFTSSGSYFVRNFYAEKRAVGNVTVTNVGSGYEQGSYTGLTLFGGTGVGATGDIVINALGEVDSFTLDATGHAYSVGDVLKVNDGDISSGDGVSGDVTSVTLTSTGFNYVDGQTYNTFYSTAQGAGSGLTLTAVTELVGKVVSLNNLQGGSGYTTGPATFTTNGSGIDLDLDIVASIDGLAETFSITTQGTGYPASANDLSTTTVTGTGSGLTVNIDALPRGVISGITVTSAGSGFLDGDSVEITGSAFGTGFQGEIEASGSGIATAIFIDTAGSGYSNGGGLILEPVGESELGQDAEVTVTTTGGSVTGVTLTSGGFNYAVGEQYYIDGSGDTVEPGQSSYNAIVEISSVSTGGSILNITINSGGTEYVAGENVSLVGETGSATGTIASVTGGDVYSLGPFTKGSGYQVGDTFTIDGGDNNALIEVLTISGGNVTSVTISNPNLSSGFINNELITFTGRRSDGVDSVISVAQATIGELTGLTVVNAGSDYKIGEELTVDGGSGGGTFTIANTSDGSGFTISVDSLDITNSIAFDVDTGALTSLEGTIGDLTSTTGTITTLGSTDVTIDNNLEVPSVSSATGLAFSVTDDIDITTTYFNIGTTVSFESATGNVSLDGSCNVGSLVVDSNLTLDNNVISTAGDTPLLLQPYNNRLVKIDSNSSIVVPVGTTNERPLSTAETGAIRFNTDIDQYEGYNASTSLWSSLGGIRDTDGNTYIIPEASSGANDNILYFYNDGSNSAQLSETTLTFYTANELVADSGQLDVTSTSIVIDNQLSLSTAKISTSSSNITLEPGFGSSVVIDSVTSLALPVGTSAERGSNLTGGIRYNTSTTQFEGYNGSNWTSLGGVRDVDGNTFITAEENPGDNDNTLRFFTDGFDAVRLSSSSLEFRDIRKVTTADVFGISEWAESTSFTAGDEVYYLGNVYEAAITFLEGSTGPTHSSGTVNNWIFVRTTAGQLTLEDMTVLRVNAPINVNGKLTLTSNNIGTVDTDLIITPVATKKVQIDSETSLVLPVGTSAERGSPLTGSVRFNTDNQQYEGYSGANWTSLGGVRDVDGNTYIIPELTVGGNENTLYFFNDGTNTIQVTPTALVLENIDIIDSTQETLSINSNSIDFNSALELDTSTTSTRLLSSQNNFDLGLSGYPLLRLSGAGDISVNTTFGTADTYTTLFNNSLSKFELADTVYETSRTTIEKGINDFTSFILFDGEKFGSCKLTVLAVNTTANTKHMVDYNIILESGDIYNIEYEGLKSDSVIYDATFDVTGDGEARVTVTLDAAVTSGDEVQFTFINTRVRI